MEIYLIRHGQSTNNALMEDQHLRVQDPALTPVGEQQAEKIAEFLATTTKLEDMVKLKADAAERKTETFPYSFTHLYCSPMYRALQTARPIGEALGLNPHVWVDIHEHGGIFLEQDKGVAVGFGGMTRAEIAAEFPHYTLPDLITDKGWWNPYDGMEHISNLVARTTRVMMELKAWAAERPNDRVALVAHGAFIGVLLKAFLGMLPNEHFYFWHYNTAVTQIDILSNGRVILRYVNRVTHLPPELVT